jgi:hypothetical protein
MAYPVLDIGRIPDELLATDPFLQSVLGLLKYGRHRDFKDKLEFLDSHGDPCDDDPKDIPHANRARIDCRSVHQEG